MTPDPPVAAEQAFVAPCRSLTVTAPLAWLRRGWADLRAAPRQSLTFGTLVVAASALVALIALRFGGYWELLALVTGFVFIAPVLAVGTYAISAQLERGLRPALRQCWREERAAVGNLLVFALMLMVVFLVWARAGSAVHVFFPIEAEPVWSDYLRFYAIGSAVGSIFALVVFAAAAFSLPMLVDRRVDAVTAVVTSINAVLRNKPAMLVWGACIVLAVAPGFALLTIGGGRSALPLAALLLLGVTMPLIGHATWHAYHDAIDASDWPARFGEDPD